MSRRLSDHIAAGPAHGFDVIRVLAALGVIVGHSFYVTRGADLTKKDFGAWNLGGFCVSVFFVISGFLIAQSSSRNRNPIRFAEKRILRIMPALLVVVTLTAAVLGPLLSTESVHDYFVRDHALSYLRIGFFLPHRGNLPGVFTQLPASGAVNGSLWTLRYEVFCYLFLGVLAYAFRCRSAAPYVLLAILGTAIELIFGMRLEAHAPLFQLVELGNIFLLGAAFFWASQYIVIERWSALLAFIVFCVMIRTPVPRPISHFVLAYAVIAFGYLSNGLAFLKNRDYSYGIYLYAFPVQQVLERWHRMAWYTNILLAVPITLLCAMFSWHLIEDPARALKHQAHWLDAIRARFQSRSKAGAQDHLPVGSNSKTEKGSER